MSLTAHNDSSRLSYSLPFGVLKLVVLRQALDYGRGRFYARVEWWSHGERFRQTASDTGHTPMQAARLAWRSARRAQLKAITKALTS
jgi:hypothetical protein